MAGKTVCPLAVGPGFMAIACTDIWNSFSLEGYFAKPRYSREGLGPSSKQCALSSLRCGWGWEGREGRGNGRRGGSGNWDWYE